MTEIKKNLDRNFFWLKMVYKSSPVFSLVNIIQYSLMGVSGVISFWAIGNIVNILSDDNVAFVELLPWVSLVSFMFISSDVVERFSQYFREKHIFAVRCRVEKELFLKLSKISHDIQDTSCFQKKFSLISQNNSKIYLYLTYSVQILGQTIRLFGPIVIVGKLSIIFAVLLMGLAAVCVRVLYANQFIYWSAYMSSSQLGRRKRYFLDLFRKENFLGIVSSYKKQDYFMDITKKVSEEASAEANRIIGQDNFRFFVIQMIVLVVPVGLTLMSILYYTEGRILVGDVVMYIGIGKQIHNAIVSLGETTREFKKVSLSLDDLYFFFKEDFSFKNKEEISNPVSQGKKFFVEMNNIRYKYLYSDINAVDNVSFFVKKGDNIALVGENGSGKTTISKILLGLYQNYKGSVFVTPFLDCNTAISACFQDFVQPHFTMREAVCYSDDDEHDQEIKELLNSLGYLVVDKSELDGLLGAEFTGGLELSYGNWQKIAIARALFHDKGIVVFDEPMASLDVYSELLFINMLKKRKKQGKTTIVISHRMIGMEVFDKIIVISNGKIAGIGSHNELINNNNIYRDLFYSQVDMG